MIDMSNKTHNISKKEYMGLFESQNIFLLNHGRYPNYVTKNNTANNPLVLNYQNDKYSCCVASFNMCVQMLFDWISEEKIKKIFKTGVKGTSPDNMIDGAKSLGYTVTRIKRDFKSISSALSKGYAVLIHYETAGKTKPDCMDFMNNYGHYAMIYKAKDNYYWVADPTKGLKKCRASEIDKATNGRSIYYYSVKPK